jgi:hypothetical protein
VLTLSKNINKQNTPFDTGPHTKPVNKDNNHGTKHENDSKNRTQTKKRVSST